MTPFDLEPIINMLYPEVDVTMPVVFETVNALYVIPTDMAGFNKTFGVAINCTTYDNPREYLQDIIACDPAHPFVNTAICFGIATWATSTPHWKFFAEYHHISSVAYDVWATTGLATRNRVDAPEPIGKIKINTFDTFILTYDFYTNYSINYQQFGNAAALYSLLSGIMPPKTVMGIQQYATSNRAVLCQLYDTWPVRRWDITITDHSGNVTVFDGMT